MSLKEPDGETMREVSNVVNGVVAPGQGEAQELVNPSTGEVFGAAPVSSEADVDAAVGAEPGGFGADAFDPIELAAQVFETLPLDAVDELA